MLYSLRVGLNDPTYAVIGDVVNCHSSIPICKNASEKQIQNSLGSVMLVLVYLILFIAISCILGISGQVVLSSQESERIVFFGDSIPFAGSLTDRGFISLLQNSLHSEDDASSSKGDSSIAQDAADARAALRSEEFAVPRVHHTIENIGQHHFDLDDFSRNRVTFLLGHYKPSIAVFMLVDDVMLHLLDSWLLDDNRKRSERIDCVEAECENFESIASEKVRAIQKKIEMVLGKTIDACPSCRIVLTMPLSGVHDSVQPHSRDLKNVIGTQGMKREEVLREKLRSMLKQLCFDFSSRGRDIPFHLQPFVGGEHQYSRYQVELIDIAYSLERMRSKHEDANIASLAKSSSLSSSRVRDGLFLNQHSMDTHGTSGTVHMLSDVEHVVLAHSFASLFQLDGHNTVNSLVTKLFAKGAYASVCISITSGLSLQHLMAWQSDSEKVIRKQRHI